MKVLRPSSERVQQVQDEGLPLLRGEELSFVVASLEATRLGAHELLQASAELLPEGLRQVYLLRCFQQSIDNHFSTKLNSYPKQSPKNFRSRI